MDRMYLYNLLDNTGCIYEYGIKVSFIREEKLPLVAIGSSVKGD
jgi:hypothetical protein